MRELSTAGQQAITALAQQHGVSSDAVLHMLDAVMNGNGSMAQFNHREFGGSGQWMRGGMIMLSDMFNSPLKARVDALCVDLAAIVATQPDLLYRGSFQSQSQGVQHQQNGNEPSGTASLFVPGAPSNWWPSDLGSPNSTGAQNNVRYAYFAQAHRLAIDINGTVTIYDTLDHQIGGFSQQQSVGGSITFASQFGPVDIATLPILSINGAPPDEPAIDKPDADIFTAIEKLAALHARGILSNDEFATKKAELLSRL